MILYEKMMAWSKAHEAAAAMFKDNPHFTIPTSYVDVMEIPHMGM